MSVGGTTMIVTGHRRLARERQQSNDAESDSAGESPTTETKAYGIGAGGQHPLRALREAAMHRVEDGPTDETKPADTSHEFITR